MRNPALVAAVAAGKASALATRLMGRGGGTALPGLVAHTIYPSVLRALTSQLPEGSLMVTGTNGKTTTSRMLGSILEAAGLDPLHNRSGSNLERGLVSTMVDAATPAGGLPGSLRAGLFEVDEAALPNVISAIRPRVALFNNLFRDQLDRYGEIDTVYRKWRDALPAMRPRSTVVLNADDPAIAALTLAPDLRAKVFTFGIDDPRYALDALPHAADSISCPRCNSRLEYSLILLGHLGHWRCPECGLERPTLDVGAKQVKLNGTESSELHLETPSGPMQVTLHVPGLYNAYNGLAAVSAALAFGVAPQYIKEGLDRFTAAFGRIERVSIPNSDDNSLLMALVKNPVGFNEVLRMLFPLEEREGFSPAAPKHLMIVINDLFADGRDVSWLWDVDFEILSANPGMVGRVQVSGIRAGDMAVRLKYAGVDPQLISINVEIPGALEEAIRALRAGETLYVLPTYTAMLAFRKMLYEKGWVQNQFWEQ
ncbi:MAG: MurT ligase domain-containing protein [Chloroflexota bacterium]|nr:MurT ligase domain-containing protein [Chloroflexota bacterium]